MKVLAILRPPDGTDVRAAIAAHAVHELCALWQLYRDDAVREMYSPGRAGAILILEADSLAAARSTLGQLPLLTHNVMTLEVIELHPFAALQMLFDRSRP